MNLPVLTSCDACGACCMVVGVPPYLDEIDFIPAELRAEWVGMQQSWTERGEPEEPCPWLDLATRKCRHYDDRPNICREYERGDDECRAVRRRVGIDSDAGT